MVLNRKQFIKHFSKLLKQAPGAVEDYNHPIWIAENRGSIRCEWFLCVEPVVLGFGRNPYFWDWCDENLSGGMTCFSSGDIEEWWGFENKTDISLWLLRWSKWARFVEQQGQAGRSSKSSTVWVKIENIVVLRLTIIEHDWLGVRSICKQDNTSHQSAM